MSVLADWVLLCKITLDPHFAVCLSCATICSTHAQTADSVLRMKRVGPGAAKCKLLQVRMRTASALQACFACSCMQG
jgi:hypothetical protein